MRRWTRIMIGALLLALMLAGGVVVYAATPEASFQVTVLYASKGTSNLDPRVRPYLAKLVSQFPYTSYRLESDTRQNGGLAKELSFALPGGRTLTLTPQRLDKSGNLTARLALPGLLDTDLVFTRGGELLLGGPRYENGVLILLITLLQ